MTRTLLKNICTIVNVVKSGPTKVRHEDLDHIEITTSGSGSSLAILVENGTIIDFGEEKHIMRTKCNSDSVIDCNGGCVIPGFVDAHTHPLWVGDGLHEFIMKVKGLGCPKTSETAADIQHITAETMAAGELLLYETLKRRLKSMIRRGTTTVECKTGYGTEWEIEKKLLRVLCKAKKELPLDISVTFMAAPSIPRGYTAEEFAKHVVHEQFPLLSGIKREGIHVDNLDLYCERGHFTVPQAQLILEAGKSMGLNLNFHADELTCFGGAELAGKLGARAASHLEEVSPVGVASMAASGTAAVLLPTTAQLLKLRPPPARAMIEAGVPVALGTDFSPSVYCLSMPVVMYLACTMMEMTPNEALVAATINAAYSLGLSDRVGAITVNRQADLVVLNCDRWENIIYQLGEAESLITHVIKRGNLVFSQDTGFIGF